MRTAFGGVAAGAGLLAGLALSTLGAAADPRETVSNGGANATYNVTVYNGGNSLVHDRRKIALRAGENAIAWRDVSSQMDATSALLSDLSVPGGVAMREQNFDYDLLTPSALLDKYVGHDVIVVHDRRIPGEPVREKARLLSDNGGIVLQYRDRVETAVDGHLIFPGIPENLRDRATLVLDVASEKAATQTLDLAYLTGGLGWRADYVGVVAPDERSMSIGGLVTLSNQSGTTYANARLQLVAGNVQFVMPVPAPAFQPGQTVNSYSIGPAVTQENYFEYHLYTLGRPTTLANNQIKQVALLSAKHVPIRKTLELRGSQSYYTAANADLGDKLNVGVYIAFTNKGGDLGIPLPGGTFRLYKNDRAGTSQFLGSDTIDHTPRDQDVRLHVGDSFDVTANKKQTAFRNVGLCTDQSSYAIAVSNAKDVAQKVLVVEPVPDTWSIPSTNFPYVKTSSATATWTLDVPARKTVTLHYTASVRYCERAPIGTGRDQSFAWSPSHVEATTQP